MAPPLSNPAIRLASRLPPSWGTAGPRPVTQARLPFSALNRLIQRRTVAGWHSSSLAICDAGNPCTDSSTISARPACRHGLRWHDSLFVQPDRQPFHGVIARPDRQPRPADQPQPRPARPPTFRVVGPDGHSCHNGGRREITHRAAAQPARG
jgi:hypothetical protein